MMTDSDSFGILPIPKVATFRTFFKSQNVIANNRLCITCKIGHKKSYRNEMSCNFARILLFGARQQQTESPHYGLKILKKCKLGIIKLLFFSKDFLIGLYKKFFLNDMSDVKFIHTNISFYNTFWALCYEAAESSCTSPESPHAAAMPFLLFSLSFHSFFLYRKQIFHGHA